MSRTLQFYGASDDLFEIEGTRAGEPDEIGCFERIAAVKVANDHAGLFVAALYNPPKRPDGLPGCWTIGICPLEEDVPLPDWPMRWELASNGYSTKLTLEAPDDVRVSEVE